jgi:hypothetical protein
MALLISIILTMNLSLITVRDSIYQASKEFSIDYSVLSKIADIESNFNPDAKARTSSARGLFQIIKNTELWLRDTCKISGNIFDPLVNSRMGACLTSLNIKQLKSHEISPTELNVYLVHFLGINNGIKFIRTADYVIAAELFKYQAKYNRPVFYDRDGTPRSVGQIKAYFQSKLDTARVL